MDIWTLRRSATESPPTSRCLRSDPVRAYWAQSRSPRARNAECARQQVSGPAADRRRGCSRPGRGRGAPVGRSPGRRGRGRARRRARRLRIQTLDVVDPEVGVEHVRRDDLAVRSRERALEVREVNVAAISPRIAVVVRDAVVELDVEAEGVPVVVGRPADVLDEQHGRMTRQRHEPTILLSDSTGASALRVSAPGRPVASPEAPRGSVRRRSRRR
jgi:hypothetical protein